MLKILHKDYKDKVNRLLSVMLPIIGTQIAIMGMNFFDASMSGQAGDADLAGAAIGGNIWMPVQTCFAGILLAAMPLIANLLGAGEKEKISTVVRHGMLLAVAFSVLIIVGGVIFLPPFFAGHGPGTGGLSHCAVVYGRLGYRCVAVLSYHAVAQSC